MSTYLWKNNNATLKGQPDLEFVAGRTYYWELKYVNRPPRNRGAKLLKHPFTPTQYKNAYLINRSGIWSWEHGSVCAGLVGLHTSAFIVPPSLIKKENFTYDELMMYNIYQINKYDGHWHAGSILEYTRRAVEGDSR